MTEFIPSEKGTPIRYPSTANLCIDSRDRPNAYSGGGEPDTASPFDFQITRRANILTGYFTRVSATEFCLEWAEPNIQTNFNDEVTFDVSGAGDITVTIAEGFYTVADCLDALVDELNTTSSGTWSVEQANGQVGLKNDTNDFTVATGTLGAQLFPYDAYYTASGTQFLTTPDIRYYRYIDITSNDLTYNQDLKDSSTNQTVVDTLARIYMVYDTYSGLDAYGFPIRFGYKPDTLYRNFTLPKSIKWAPNMPIGNIRFQVFGSLNYGNQTNKLIPWFPNAPTETNWMMTLQVSEV